MARDRKTRRGDRRTRSWREVGTAALVDVKGMRRAILRAVLELGLFAAIVIVHAAPKNGKSLLGIETGSTAYYISNAVAAVLLILTGWLGARDLGRAVGPIALRRMDPPTAGAVSFVARLVATAIVLVIVLRVAGVSKLSLTIGVSLIAVVFGLAAQQTLGNVFAGTVLLSARPFRVGDRIRLQAGVVGGQIEGVVREVGLLYTSLLDGDQPTFLPNSVVLNCVVFPLHEPDSVDLQARLPATLTPGELRRRLETQLRTPLRGEPRITLEELDGDELVVTISATPQLAADGAALAGELVRVVSRETRAAGERDGDGRPRASEPAPADA